MIFSTRRDRERIGRLDQKKKRYEALAESARDNRERRAYEKTARRVGRQAQMARTFPLSIWLFGLVCLLPLLAWSLLKRAGHGRLGVLTGLAVAGIEAWVVYRRRPPGG